MWGRAGRQAQGPAVGPSLSQGSLDKRLEGQAMEWGRGCQLVPGPHSQGVVGPGVGGAA